MLQFDRPAQLAAATADFTFVRAEVRGYLKNKTGFGRYELVEFQA